MLVARLHQPKKQLGLYLTADGFAVAEVDYSADDSPALSLKRCDFITSSDAAERQNKLARYAREHNLKNKPCVVVLEDMQYSLFQMPIPPVDDSELKSALRWGIKDLISYPVEEAVIDVFRVPVQKHREAKAYVVVSHKDEIQNTVDMVRAAGLTLSTIDIEELSLGNIVEQMTGQARGIAVVNFGRQHGSISLYSDSALYLSRRIETGLDQIEEMQSAGVVEQNYESIILELQRSLDFYESEYARPPITRLVVAPRHPVLQGFCDYVGSQTGLTIELMNLGQIYTDSTELNDETQARCLLAIGAASRKTVMPD